MRQLAALLGLLTLCGCMGGFSENRAHERFDQTLPAAGVTELHLQSVAGTVSIRAWEKPQIRIEAVKSAPDAGALKALHVTVRQSGSTVEVGTQYDAGFGISRGGVEYTIMVPAAVNLQVENTAGTVEIAGMTGNVSADAKAGTIEATMGKAGGDQNINLATTTGTVTLRIPKHSDATVTARSMVGTVESDFPSVTRTRNNLIGSGGSGKIGNGSAAIKLTTTTGTIDLRST